MAEPDDAPVRLIPSLQHYAWGDPAFIPDALGLARTGEPVAEAWYGAHSKAPATAVTEGGSVPLDAWLDQRDGELPYLLKLLAATKPLSIQVHPNAAQAAAGFAEEEAAGVPIDAPHRRFRDPNHKPEVIVALTDFAALCGFRAQAGIEAALERLPELAELLPSPSVGIEALLRAWFGRPQQDVSAALGKLMTRLAAEHDASDPTSPEAWALRAHRVLGGEPDPGLLLVFLLELVQLKPGQAMFLPAGVPHAYLDGAGVELMASSDNVLRAGLTTKHVDPQALLEVVRFDAEAPVVLEPIEFAGGVEATWSIPATEFDLVRWRLDATREQTAHAAGLETLIAIVREPDATVTVEHDGGSLALRAGEACLVTEGTRYRVRASAGADVYRVRIPGPAVDARPSFRGRDPTALKFGTSGLRGLVTDITDLEAYVNTRGFLDVLVARGEIVPGGEVALAGDLRPSTPSIMRAVAAAVNDAGLRVVCCGRIPTPALTYYGLQRGIPSIMVTGSHIPFDRNGIKLVGSRGEVLKSDEAAIVAAVERVRRREYGRAAASSRFDDDGGFREAPGLRGAAIDDARAMYVQRYLDAFGPDALSGAKVVFYEHSAVGRELVAEILRALGAEVIAMGRSESFVAIDTEAIAAERLEALQNLADEAIAAHGSIDAIVSTDGDSDRPMLLGIDGGRVRFFGGDLLGAITAELLEADAVAVPVSSNDAIDRHLEPRGIPVERTRIGSPYVIAAMASLPGKRRAGWEANGGFLLGSAIELPGGTLQPLPTRDAVLPIVAALRSAKQRGCTLVELFSALPRRFGRAGLLDAVPQTRSRALLERFGPRALDRQEALARHFTPARGFSDLESIDDTDGLRLRFSNGDVAHVRPSGNAPQLRIYATADTEARADAIVTEALREPDGILRSMLAAAHDPFVEAIRRNIEATTSLFETGVPPAVIGTVCGSATAQAFWQGRLDLMRPSFRARAAIAFHEDLPVNQALGLLLLWKRLSPHLRAGEGALVAFVFGEGTRATPFTEAEQGQKPAIESFVTEPSTGRRLSIVELAMRYFAPVESHLRRSGFEGIVVKWGDEVQIPTRDLSGTDSLFEHADVVRFVSMRELDADRSANKDWVGVDANGRVTAFIPRRPLEQMEALADRGLLQRREGRLFGGVNLGSIALSRALLDALLQELAAEVDDPTADRRTRPDLDPQLFTALTVAAIADPGERDDAWSRAKQDSPAIARLVAQWPDVLTRLRRALDRFEARHGRPIRMVAMDFGDQYWGDIGQHAKMYEFYAALRDPGAQGRIARALAGVDVLPDANGNLLVGNTRLGNGVIATRSVFIDAQIDAGEVDGSVLVGTRCGHLRARDAFDIGSTVAELRLEPRAGTYKVVSDAPVEVPAGQRCTTVFLPDETLFVRVEETTDLRDRATTYDVPILGNAKSFAEIHAAVLATDPSSRR